MWELVLRSEEKCDVFDGFWLDIVSMLVSDGNEETKEWERDLRVVVFDFLKILHIAHESCSDPYYFVLVTNIML